MSRILDGNRVRDAILEELRPRVEALRAAGRPPGLAVVLAGSDPASAIYVRNKVRACAALGIYSESHTPPGTATTAELVALVEELNARPEIDGILVQMPLPAGADSRQVLLAVDPAKDVDGFHPMNLGNLLTGRPGPRPCTPAGIIELLRRAGIALAGANAVVIGRSEIVGKPMALLLLEQHATVTICHSRTRNLPEVASRADLVVAAIGRPGFVTTGFLRPGAVVVDVGINRVEDPPLASELLAAFPDRLQTFREKGSVVVGDVHPSAYAVSSAHTPVPGGVGPLTIAMLMANTVAAAERRLRVC